jgi:hypothetical protein
MQRVVIVHFTTWSNPGAGQKPEKFITAHTDVTRIFGQITVIRMGYRENNAIDLSALREFSRTELLQLLDRLRGPKIMVLDPALSGPINLIAEVSLLKEHGVEKTTTLKNEPLVSEQRQIMYLVRAKTSNMKIIADHIRNHLASSNTKYDYFVCMVPQRYIEVGLFYCGMLLCDIFPF